MDEQRDAVDFLSRPDSSGLADVDIERIDTHSAVVFLVGDRVYKMKRAVDLGFLDFTTLQARHRYCEREVALNRRTAPTLYLGVSALTREADGAIAFGGAGEPFEYVVVLRRFDQRYLLDRMAGRGELDASLMIALADRIAGFHETAEVVAGEGAAAIRRTIEGNRESFAALPEGMLDAAAVARLTEVSLARCEGLAGRLDRRAAEGRVRVCHGDLHLQNICLFEGEPTIFDCIEFNRELSDIDVLYDLAFLLMDLDHRGHGDLANTVFNRYLDRRDEADGVAALPLLLSMRAAIRAHVSGQAARVQADAAARDERRGVAAAYLEHALSLLAPAGPHLVAVGGFSGTGKSTLAYGLAPGLDPAPGARVLRSDVLRKRRYGVDPEEALPEEAYRPEVSEAVYTDAFEQAAALLADGHSVILDMVFDRPEDRARAEAVAARADVPFAGFWLTAPRDVLAKRIRSRSGDASDASVAVLDRQLRRDPGPMGWRELDAAREAAAIAAEARGCLGLSR
ncbi:AAA family ATPase [Arhodomonas sp. SL1]|uniref:bifunctional aminoglycoside phosphotransferase/ATP-binding protein n=1 Tax=Arhodomonas sp. SL1 TaxID=3425691 RepID=UPI003F884170